MSEKPLDGYRVVDLTHVLAGPYCTYQLGLLGADVIKVESLRGDMVRNWGGTDDQLVHRLGTGFAAQNAGKRSLAVDLTRPEGAEIVRTLAERADIFVENYRPGALARYSLDYEPVRERNPGLIYLSISAFGQTGPHGHRPGFDDVVQATSGFMSINVRGDGPIRTGGPVLDYATGMHATSAVLAAALSWLYLFRDSGYAANPNYTFLNVMPVATMVFLSTVSMILVSLVTKPPSAATLKKFFKDVGT